jgi:dGTP triphosphohydrolase
MSVLESVISKYVTAVDIANDQGEYPLLKIPPYLRAQVDVLKELTWFYVIDNRSIKTQQHGQRMVVKNLFTIVRMVHYAYMKTPEG